MIPFHCGNILLGDEVDPKVRLQGRSRKKAAHSSGVCGGVKQFMISEKGLPKTRDVLCLRKELHEMILTS
jgi:hypothetical protein